MLTSMMMAMMPIAMQHSPWSRVVVLVLTGAHDAGVNRYRRHARPLHTLGQLAGEQDVGKLGLRIRGVPAPPPPPPPAAAAAAA